MVIDSLVAGLIPILSAFSTTEKVPKPTNDTLSPLFSAFETAETTPSTAFYASAMLKPDSAATALIRSALFIMKTINY